MWLLFAKEKEVKPFKATKPLRFDLQFFSDGGEGGEGGDSGNGGEGGSGDVEPFATFKTKDDFNKRLNRAEKKGQKALAEQLGYDSVEAMLTALDKDKDKDKSKDKDKKTDSVDVDALLESKLKEEREKTFKRLVNSEVKVLASELGFADWEDALALADLSQVKEDDKGNIAGVKEALEALAKKKPHLLKQKGNGGVFGVTVPNNGGNGGSQKPLEEIKKMAQNRGTSQTQAYNPWA
ncbi:scaffolding protein [Bacillus oleronius]|nr:scaffolding protein [Heyndrickxia oleronia]